MTIFEDANPLFFTDPNLAIDADYRAGGAGAPLPVRVIWSQPLREQGFGDAGAMVSELTASVQRAQLSVKPARGDTLTVDVLVSAKWAGVYKIEKCGADDHGTNWELTFSK